MEIYYPGQDKWFCTFVYASPNEEGKRDLWGKLGEMSLSVEGQWLVVGDFNDFKSQAENSGGNPANLRRCALFEEMINECGFIEMDSYGPLYTWKGPLFGDYDRVFERLDRGFCNMEWRLIF